MSQACFGRLDTITGRIIALPHRRGRFPVDKNIRLHPRHLFHPGLCPYPHITSVPGNMAEDTAIHSIRHRDDMLFSADYVRLPKKITGMDCGSYVYNPLADGHPILCDMGDMSYNFRG